MKIAIDISQLVYEGTGVATYTYQLVKNLLKLDKSDEYILFGLSLRKFDKLLDFYAEFKSLNTNLSSRFFHIPLKMAELFGNRLHMPNIESLIGEVDIFHSSDWIQPKTSAKKVTTIHDLTVFKYPQVSHPYIVATQKRRLNWVKRECDMVLADSESTKREIIDILHMGSEKIETVYPGLSEKFTPASGEKIARVKQKYGLYDEYILAVGTIEPRKNLKGVAAAFERFLKHPLISSRKKPLELVIAGKFGWGEKLTANNYIKILGYVDGEDLPGLYSGAAMFLYPSFYEGFGFPVLEAMACGCPVITSDRGSLEEISADCALLADPDAPEDIAMKMTQLYVDRKLRADLVEKGKKNAQKYSWEKTAGKVIGIYEKLNKVSL